MSAEPIDDGVARLRYLIQISRVSPATFAKFCLRVQLRRWQERALAKIQKKIEAGETSLSIAICTCFGAGKTTLAAILLLWVIFTNPDSKAITLAQGWEGVDKLLWAKVRTLYRGSLMAELAWGQVYDVPFLKVDDDWFAVGLSAKDEQALRGHHSTTAGARFIDEATAVPRTFRFATSGILDAPFSVDVSMTNPWTKDNWFWELWSGDDPNLIRVRVTQHDLIAEGIPGAQTTWERALREFGGIDAPEVRAMYLAEFIDVDPGGRVNSARLDECISKAPTRDGLHVIGVDVADSKPEAKRDETVFSDCWGLDVLEQRPFRVKNTELVAERAMLFARETGAKVIRVDAVGVGSGVTSHIRTCIERGDWDGELEEFAENAPAENRGKTKFSNLAAETAWGFCDRINEVACSLPNDPILRAQILKVRFVPVQGGKWSLMKTPENGKSPDRFDSAMIGTACRQLTAGDALLGAMARWS